MYRSVAPSRSTTTSVTAVPAEFVSSFTACEFVSSVTFACSSAGRTPSTSASAFPCTAQGNPSQFVQRTQALWGMSGSFEPDTARRVERVIARCGEIVRELLDPRLVRHRRERVRRTRRRIGRVLPVRPVHLVEAFGLRVVRLQLVV